MKTVAYNSSQLLACAQCNGEAVICVDDSLTVSGAPFLDVTVVSVEEDKDTCGNCYYLYGLSYDEYALVDPATGLVTGDIDGIFCKGCLVTYMENLAATVWEDAALKVIIPPGTIWMWGGAAAPTGWLLCDHSAVSRVTYADLFAEIGITYGAGDGFSTFNTPDMQQKFPLGYSSGVNALGDTGGAFDHTHNIAAHIHTLPNHTHTLSAHTHPIAQHRHQFDHIHYIPVHKHPGGSHVHVSGTLHAQIGNDSTVLRWVAGGGTFLANRRSATVFQTTVSEAQGGAVSVAGSTGGAVGDTGDYGPFWTLGPHTPAYAPNTYTDYTTLTTQAPTAGMDVTSASGSGNTGSTGAAATDAANPPYTVVNFIIKT